MSPTEEWRPVPGFPGYEVSGQGRVLSHVRKAPRYLRPSSQGKGYLQVVLIREGQRISRTVHSLVAEAFHGQRPVGQQVRHLDGNRTNNVAWNLAWGSASENAQDAIRHGTHPMAGRTHCRNDHPFDAVNTRVAQGRRYCRACDRAKQRAARDRRILRTAAVTEAVAS